MQAIVYHKYGNPEDVFSLQEIETPIPKENEVLVRIHATSINASDYEFTTGKPAYVRIWGLNKPKLKILGSDIAGHVEAVGSNVKQFKPGDEVYADTFGSCWGGFAEYVCIPKDLVFLKPTDVSYIDIAAMPQAGTVALQGLRYKNHIKAGQSVLINGAGGGSGTYAIQLAKQMGAVVTGVDNSEKQELMISQGADYVIDYTKEDFTKNNKQYDLIVNFTATKSIFHYKKALAKNGVYALVGGSLSSIFQTLFFGSLISLTSKKQMGLLSHNQNKTDLEYMIQLYRNNKVKPVIDSVYTLSETATALKKLGSGKAKGKIIITQ